MSKRDKLIEKICSGGQVSIDEIKHLMESLGYSIRQSGSHVSFSKKDAAGITIPAKAQVRKIYLKQLCELLNGQ